VFAWPRRIRTRLGRTRRRSGRRRTLRYAAAILSLAILAVWAGFAVAVMLPIERALLGFDARVEALRREFAARPADRDPVERVRAELRHMVEVDQTARDVARAPRERGDGALSQLYFQWRFHPRAVAIERRHVERLSALIEQHGWIRSRRFGDQADRHAWLLAHHADVHPEFQKRVLAILETQWRRGETAGQNYARLFDRVAANEGRPQRYGTRGRCTGLLRWEARPIEAEAALDARRRSVGLEPFEAQRLRNAAACRAAEPY
jgi:hypothetical protein